MEFLDYLTDQEIAVLIWALLPFAVLLVVLGIREIVHVLARFRRVDATLVDAEHLPAAPHIYHLTFAYDYEGQHYEATTRDTFDEGELRRYRRPGTHRLYVRRSEPTLVKTSRASAILLGLAALVLGLGVLAWDLWLLAPRAQQLAPWLVPLLRQIPWLTGSMG